MGRIKRPCLDCGTLTEGSRCEVHRTQREAQRTLTYHRDGWTEYAASLVRAEPWCHVCGRRDVKLVAGHVVAAALGGRTARPVCYRCNALES